MSNESIIETECLQYKSFRPIKETINLFTGIDIQFRTAESAPPPTETAASEQTVHINCCASGKAAIAAGDGGRICLNPGDFAISLSDASLLFSDEQSHGITITIDIEKATADPPQILSGTNLCISDIYKKYCSDNTVTYIVGSDKTNGIFEAFSNHSDKIRLPYLRIKTLELLLYLMQADCAARKQLSTQSELGGIVREIHDRLTGQMDERITIEDLARQYLINPTTLKSAFKEIYGTSIAAHIREHRMEKAAKLLRESHLSICDIAKEVGYDSQSKFAVAFKGYYGVLPREYRKA